MFISYMAVARCNYYTYFICRRTSPTIRSQTDELAMEALAPKPRHVNGWSLYPSMVARLTISVLTAS